MNKINYVIGMTTLSCLFLLVGCKNDSFKTKEITLKKNRWVVEYGNKIPKDVTTYLANKMDFTGNIELIGIPKNETEKEYPAIGEYQLTLKNDDQERKIKVIVTDTIAPVFNDIKEIYEVEYGKKFDLKNIKAEDLSSVDYTLDDSSVNYKKAGTYDAIVIAKDSSYNESKQKIKIKVKTKKENSKSESTLNKIQKNDNQSSDNISEEKNYFHRININCILQNPELPSGCEITSLTMSLNYNGYKVDKIELSDNFLPKGKIGETDYNVAFVGNPKDNTGFGCYAPVIVNTANNYLKSVESKKTAFNLTGSSLQEIFKYIDSNIPVIVWVTNEMKAPYISRTWYVNGKELSWKSNEHCLLLIGYNKEKNVVYTCDPLRGNVTYNMDLFNERYIQMGSQSVIIK